MSLFISNSNLNNHFNLILVYKICCSVHIYSIYIFMYICVWSSFNLFNPLNCPHLTSTTESFSLNIGGSHIEAVLFRVTRLYLGDSLWIRLNTNTVSLNHFLPPKPPSFVLRDIFYNTKVEAQYIETIFRYNPNLNHNSKLNVLHITWYAAYIYFMVNQSVYYFKKKEGTTLNVLSPFLCLQVSFCWEIFSGGHGGKC